ncbi:Glycoside hydrolase [Macleaya cordata]|uniref:Glycoside hydrolase n=1 Tax=Macleaya cordata TaxID=56857 RepID=A0A200Q863_MACCD|nr:Glycoside hydrolase [Macleaya cordata]
MKEMGLDGYRFSISWSRLLPNGKLSGGVNKQGIIYYNNLINELLSNGVQPFVTLFHWDLPQALDDEYGGFLSPHIVDDFKDYAELCYREFGDRVKHWITLNEPWTYTNVGYALGQFPPARCSKSVGNCSAGNSGTEPYLVSHYQLLAHAAAVRVYKDKYQAYQKGKIGITLVCHWMVPFSKAKSNQDAAQRAIDFMLGWFMDPLIYGDYPPTMRSIVADRLPKFSEDQYKLIKGSFDFIGLNYYTANYAAHAPLGNNVNPSYTTDAQAKLTTERNGVPIGPKAASNWLYVYPQGIRNLLVYTKKKYNNPVIYITENGISELNNANLTLEEALKDDMRVKYYDRHLFYIQRAIKEGVDVRGYFAWSLLDNFEWSSGYTVRFGINYVDYKNGLKRYPKTSAFWFKSFLKK